MSLESTLYTALTGDAGITALVSTRIYALRVPDSAAVPYISTQMISGQAFNHVNGAPDTERKLFQINCVSNTYEEAKAVAEAVKAALEASNGYMQGEGDDFFPTTQNYRVRLDWSLIG